MLVATGGKCQPYLKLTDEQQATIGRYAAEHGTVNAICHFKGDFLRLHDLAIHESFPVNSKKIMQPRNFSIANDLHYTVYDCILTTSYCSNT